MKAKRRIVAAILLLFIFLPTAASCAPAELDEGEFYAAAADLLRRAEILNEIFFEPDGLPVKESGFQSGNYKEVTATALSDFGFSSYEALLREVSLVYSDEAAAELSRLAISPDYSAGAGMTARYIVYTDPGDGENEYNGMLLAYTGGFRLSDEITIDLASIEITGVESSWSGITRVTVSAGETAVSQSGAVRSENLPFSFVWENEQWRLDTLVALIAQE